MQAIVELTKSGVNSVNRALRRMLPSFLLPLLNLLSSSLLDTYAFHCINSIVKLIDSSFEALSRDLAASIRLVCCKSRFDVFVKECKSSRSEVEGPVHRLIRTFSQNRLLVTASTAVASRRAEESSDLGSALSCTVYLVFPVLKELLSVPGLCPGTEGAFSVLDRLVPHYMHS